MKIKHLRKVKAKGKYYYFFDVPLSNPRKYIALGSYLPKAIVKLNQFLNPNSHIPKFSDACHSYQNSRFYKELSPRTQKDYSNYLKTLLPIFQDMPLDSIKSKHINQFLELLSHKPVQANRHYSLFQTIFNFARQAGLTDSSNPCLGVRKFKEKPKTRLVTKKEFELFLTSIPCPIFKNQILLIALTASRKGDAVSLLKEKLVDRILTIKTGKTGNEINFIVSDCLFEVLNYLKQHSTKETFFQDAYSTFNKKFYEYLKLSKVDKFSPHDIRAMAATEYNELHGIAETQALLTHSEQKVTETYLRNKKGRTVKSL